MEFIFFLVVTPIGLVMRIMGKDLLNKKYDTKKILIGLTDIKIGVL